MFKPHLTLAREPDGEYTLHAVTITPNSCYAAGPAELGVPNNVRLVQEVASVLLHVRNRGGMCLQVLKPVRHHLANLKLGASAGKTTLTAFVLIGNDVVGSASLDVHNLGSVHPGSGPLSPIDTSDWYAWIDRESPGSASLHVTGIVTVPTPGYAVKLVEAGPQGINPKDLILDLVITRKPEDRLWPQIVTQVPVRFDQSPLKLDYESVLVRTADGSSIAIKVEQVC